MSNAINDMLPDPMYAEKEKSTVPPPTEAELAMWEHISLHLRADLLDTAIPFEVEDACDEAVLPYKIRNLLILSYVKL